MSVDPFSQANRIRVQRFREVRRGYDPAEVESFRARVAEWVDQLRDENFRLKDELREARPQLAALTKVEGTKMDDAYDQVASRLVEVIRSADDYARRVQEEADQEAKQRVAEALQSVAGVKEDAERVRQEASAEAERVRQEASAEAERVTREASAAAALAREEAYAEADRLRQGASADAERTRREAENSLASFQAEAERMFQEWGPRRTELVTEMYAIRDAMQGLAAQLNDQLASFPAKPAIAASSEKVGLWDSEAAQGDLVVLPDGGSSSDEHERSGP
jgi:DivIVA domain-containing protein